MKKRRRKNADAKNYLKKNPKFCQQRIMESVGLVLAQQGPICIAGLQVSSLCRRTSQSRIYHAVLYQGLTCIYYRAKLYYRALNKLCCKTLDILYSVRSYRFLDLVERGECKKFKGSMC